MTADHPAPALAWTAVGSPSAVRNGTLYASDSDRVRAYRLGCRGLCQPTWSAPGSFVEVEGGLVLVSTPHHRVAAYPTRCAAAVCPRLFVTPPLDPVAGEVDWETETSIDGASVDKNRVYVAVTEMTGGSNHPGTGRGRVFAFLRDCRGLCRPIWRSRRLGGPPEISTAVGKAYVASLEGLKVYDARCEAKRAPCDPAWTGRIEKVDGSANTITAAPIIHDDLVIMTMDRDVGGGDGGPVGTYLFRRQCRAKICGPLRFLDPRYTFPASPVVRGHRVFVSGIGGRKVIRAYRTSCGPARGACRRVWSAWARTDRWAPGTPPIDVIRREVFVPGRGSHLYVFPTRCVAPSFEVCTPRREEIELLDVPAPSGVLRGPGRTLLVTSFRKQVVGFPTGCRGPCHPAWSWKASRDIYGLDVAGGLVLVGTEKRTYALDPPA